MHNGEITMLKTNQLAVMKHIDEYAGVPIQLARIQEMLEANKKDHEVIMKRLDKMQKMVESFEESICKHL